MPSYVFGRKKLEKKISHRPPGVGYKFTKDGQYDLEYKRLSNRASPVQAYEAVNLLTLRQVIEKEQSKLKKEVIEEVERTFLNLRKEVSTWLSLFKSDVKKTVNKQETTKAFEEIIGDSKL